MDKTFVDTSVLICAHDVDAGRKHEIASAVLRPLWVERTGVLSTQVLQEFYTHVTRKLETPLTRPVARSIVRAYAPWCVQGLTPADITAAFEIEDAAQLDFWDALIVALAARSGARRLLSENLSAGHIIAGIMIQNPFAG